MRASYGGSGSARHAERLQDRPNLRTSRRRWNVRDWECTVTMKKHKSRSHGVGSLTGSSGSSTGSERERDVNAAG